MHYDDFDTCLSLLRSSLKQNQRHFDISFLKRDYPLKLSSQQSTCQKKTRNLWNGCIICSMEFESYSVYMLSNLWRKWTRGRCEFTPSFSLLPQSLSSRFTSDRFLPLCLGLPLRSLPSLFHWKGSSSDWIQGKFKTSFLSLESVKQTLTRQQQSLLPWDTQNKRFLWNEAVTSAPLSCLLKEKKKKNISRDMLQL
jgi:hypothetical protein